MDPFLPLDPLLSIPGSLDFLQQVSLPLGFPLGSQGQPQLSFDYSDWLYPQTQATPPLPLYEGGGGAGVVLGGMGPNDERWGRGYPPYSHGSNGSTGSRRTPSLGDGMPPPFDDHLMSPNAFGGALHPSAVSAGSSHSSTPYFHPGMVDPSLNYLPISNQQSPYINPMPPQAHVKEEEYYTKPTVVTRSRRSNGPPVAVKGPAARPPKTSQADESVPEAALHLLRLALPSTSTGSVVTTTGDDASCDEDAEGTSDATSVHSDDNRSSKESYYQRVWNHDGGHVVLPVNLGTRNAPSVSSSVSQRRRQHRPARAQREMSTSTRAESEGPVGMIEEAGRRTSSRVRKPVEKMLEYESGQDMDGGDGEEEDSGSDEQRGRSGSKGRARGKGKASSSGVKGSGSTKRANSGPPAQSSNKRAKTTTSQDASDSPRKPVRRVRRPTLAQNTTNRSFPPSVEISTTFPRFYRTFPISSAFPTDSPVHQHRHSLLTPQPALMSLPEGSKWNKHGNPFNLYNPKIVRGNADDKAGMCPICCEDVERGGEGEEKWLKVSHVPRS
jgi:hypothetical protein